MTRTSNLPLILAVVISLVGILLCAVVTG